MFNISENTAINGWAGKPGTINQAANDKNLHRNIRYDFFGPNVQKGACELFIGGEWRRVRFDVERGWARKVDVL